MGNLQDAEATGCNFYCKTLGKPEHDGSKLHIVMPDDSICLIDMKQGTELAERNDSKENEEFKRQKHFYLADSDSKDRKTTYMCKSCMLITLANNKLGITYECDDEAKAKILYPACTICKSPPKNLDVVINRLDVCRKTRMLSNVNQENLFKLPDEFPVETTNKRQAWCCSEHFLDGKFIDSTLSSKVDLKS